MFDGSGEVPFIKVYNLTKNGKLNFRTKPTFITRETHEGLLRRSRVFPNDVLMNIVGPPLGKISVVPDDHAEWNINQAIVAFRRSVAISAEYLAIALMADGVLAWITRTAKATAGQFNISVANSRKLPLPLPPISEQIEIVKSVSSLISAIDHAENLLAVSLLRSSRLRQAVLKRAFEGKLISQDPNDEPANALLERIRAERDSGIRNDKPRRLKPRRSSKSGT